VRKSGAEAQAVSAVVIARDQDHRCLESRDNSHQKIIQGLDGIRGWDRAIKNIARDQEGIGPPVFDFNQNPIENLNLVVEESFTKKHAPKVKVCSV
jgi:hypothetical protein